MGSAEARLGWPRESEPGSKSHNRGSFSKVERLRAIGGFRPKIKRLRQPIDDHDQRAFTPPRACARFSPIDAHARHCSSGGKAYMPAGVWLAFAPSALRSSGSRL